MIVLNTNVFAKPHMPLTKYAHRTAITAIISIHFFLETINLSTTGYRIFQVPDFFACFIIHDFLPAFLSMIFVFVYCVMP